MTEEKSKALDYLESIIASMRECSFKCKEFSILICSAILTVYATVTEKSPFLILICALVLFVFWVIDSFYLQKEKIFRNKYNEVASNNYEKDDNSPLDLKPTVGIKLGFELFFKSMFASFSTVLLYAPLIVASLISFFCLLK